MYRVPTTTPIYATGRPCLIFPVVTAVQDCGSAWLASLRHHASRTYVIAHAGSGSGGSRTRRSSYSSRHKVRCGSPCPPPILNAVPRLAHHYPRTQVTRRSFLATTPHDAPPFMFDDSLTARPPAMPQAAQLEAQPQRQRVAVSPACLDGYASRYTSVAACSPGSPACKRFGIMPRVPPIPCSHY